MTKVQLKLPAKLKPVFARPRGSVLYRGAHGGRGSAKSYNFAKMAAVFALVEPLRVLATREFQVSIKESFHAELKAAIQSEPWLEASFDIGVDYIRGIGPTNRGSEFIFRGLHRNIGSLKSLSGIDLTIVEEAEDVPEESWLALEATVLRKAKSEIWPIWNPKDKESPVDVRMRSGITDESLIALAELNWRDNPWFPKNLRLLREREEKRLDPGVYAWVWEGSYLENSNARVFRHLQKATFEVPNDALILQGADWGYSVDPTVLVRAFIGTWNGRTAVYDPTGDTLFVSHESFKVGLEIDDTVQEWDGLDPNEWGSARHWTTIADSANPQMISHLNRHGYTVEGAVKGKNSVQEGVRFLQDYNIVVHPRCENTFREMLGYSFVIDPLTRKVTPKLVDKDNHVIDSLRYAVEPIRNPSAITLFGTY